MKITAFNRTLCCLLGGLKLLFVSILLKLYCQYIGFTPIRAFLYRKSEAATLSQSLLSVISSLVYLSFEVENEGTRPFNL